MYTNTQKTRNSLFILRHLLLSSSTAHVSWAVGNRPVVAVCQAHHMLLICFNASEIIRLDEGLEDIIRSHFCVVSCCAFYFINLNFSKLWWKAWRMILSLEVGTTGRSTQLRHVPFNNQWNADNIIIILFVLFTALGSSMEFSPSQTYLRQQLLQ